MLKGEVEADESCFRGVEPVFGINGRVKVEVAKDVKARDLYEELLRVLFSSEVGVN